jgi:hypothetical protein
MSKAAQGFSLRRTDCTPQMETRGERRSSEKEPFVDGNLSAAEDMVGNDFSLDFRGALIECEDSGIPVVSF